MFRKLRIVVLLLILATVALGAWRSGARATEWKHTLHATVYPIAADASPQTRAGVARLSADDFAPHSNTIPQLINAYVGSAVYADMAEDEFGNLYKVTIQDGVVTHGMTAHN